MSAFFATLIAKIGLNAILGVLGTGLFLGIPLVKAWLGKAKLKHDFKEKEKVLEKEYEEKNRLMGQNFKEKHEKLEQEYQDKEKEWHDSLSKAQQKLQDMEESIKKEKYATVQFGSLKNILKIGLAEAELKGTECFEEPIEGSKVQKDGFLGIGKANYSDYFFGVAFYSFKADYGVDLKDVKVTRDPQGNIIIYGLKPCNPTVFKPNMDITYSTILRYPIKKDKDENGKEFDIVDRDKKKRWDVKEEYDKKEGWGDQQTDLVNKLRNDFFARFSNGEELKYINNLVLQKAEMFLQGIFAPYVDSNKKIEFRYDCQPDPRLAITLENFCSNPMQLEWHK